MNEGTGSTRAEYAISAELVAAHGRLFNLSLSDEESAALTEHLAGFYADVAALWPEEEDGTAVLRGDG